MKVSTQVWNLAVQKVWSREGFVLTQAFDTYHVNALLGAGETVLEEEIQFTSSQVAQFAHVTGDTNAIHLDDSAARNAGFESRISHGMLAGSELSRIFGTRMPGFGTLFLRSELAFMAPIYPDRKHVLKVRFPGKHPRSGHVPAIATIHDAAGKLCLLAYNDLLKR
jgi:acyl dehydratase